MSDFWLDSRSTSRELLDFHLLILAHGDHYLVTLLGLENLEDLFSLCFRGVSHAGEMIRRRKTMGEAKHCSGRGSDTAADGNNWAPHATIADNTTYSRL